MRDHTSMRLTRLRQLETALTGALPPAVRKTMHSELRATSAVRFGMAIGMLAFTPVAGWLLDAFGPALLFPIAAIFGIMAGLFFLPLRRAKYAAMPAAQPDTATTTTRPSLRAMLGLLGVLPIGAGRPARAQL